MNDEIEELFPAQNNVNEQGKSNIISTEYNEYQKKLISFYKLTTINNSIVSTFSVDENNCNHTVILKEDTGFEEIKSQKTFEYNSDFINNFLVPMIEDYNKENIVFNSTIEVLDENKANFIARTKSNDSLIIIGISIELANEFKDILTRKDIPMDILEEQSLNEKGISNYLVIILTIIAIGICLVGTVIFSLIYYKS